MNDLLRTPITFRTIGAAEGLVDRTVSEIQTLIISGQLTPGTRLPPERNLAEMLGVSRTVIREAVRMLVTKGLLETKHGVGNIVRQLTIDQFSEPLSLLLRTSEGGVTFDDLHQVRSLLEVENAGLAARHATSEDIARLRANVVAMQSALGDAELFTSLDADFHEAIARASHNPLLLILINSIRTLLQEYLRLVIPHLNLELQVQPFHDKILAQIERGNEEGAREAMREHLEQIRKNHQAAFGTNH